MSTDPRDQPPRSQRTTTQTTTRTGPRGTTTVRQQRVTRQTDASSYLLPIIGVVLLLLLVFLIVPPLLGWLGFGASQAGRAAQTAVAARPTISFGAESANQSGQQPTAVAVVDSGPPPSGPSPTFSAFYEQRGGIRTLGLPISNELTVNGRRIQWFERARLEYWPEFQGTPYEVQMGRLGSEMMQGREFPKPAPFVSQPGVYYFAETGYAVSEPFLTFWSQNGGLATFGYPISAAVQEELADRQVHTVQYFERARMEWHAEDVGNEVQLGLLGRALFAQNRNPSTIPTPHIIAAPPATTVPLP